METGTPYGRFVENKRLSMGFSIEKLAFKVKITTTYVKNLESGRRRNPSENVVKGIAKALKLKGKELQDYYDAYSQTTSSVPPDVYDFIMARRYMRRTLSSAAFSNASKEDWENFIEELLE